MCPGNCLPAREGNKMDTKSRTGVLRAELLECPGKIHPGTTYYAAELVIGDVSTGPNHIILQLSMISCEAAGRVAEPKDIVQGVVAAINTASVAIPLH